MKFKVGDLVRIRPEWVREYEKIPVGIITGAYSGIDLVGGYGVNVYWLREGRTHEREDPKALMLLNES